MCGYPPGAYSTLPGVGRSFVPEEHVLPSERWGSHLTATADVRQEHVLVSDEWLGGEGGGPIAWSEKETVGKATCGLKDFGNVPAVSVICTEEEVTVSRGRWEPRAGPRAQGLLGVIRAGLPRPV